MKTSRQSSWRFGAALLVAVGLAAGLQAGMTYETHTITFSNKSAQNTIPATITLTSASGGGWGYGLLSRSRTPMGITWTSAR